MSVFSCLFTFCFGTAGQLRFQKGSMSGRCLTAGKPWLTPAAIQILGNSRLRGVGHNLRGRVYILNGRLEPSSTPILGNISMFTSNKSIVLGLVTPISTSSLEKDISVFTGNEGIVLNHEFRSISTFS